MNKVSPKYQMKIVQDINDKLYELFLSHDDVKAYVEKWQEVYDEFGNASFDILFKDNKYTTIDLKKTLHQIDGETLIKMAIDLGVQTPDFIPSIPTFKNELKSNYKTASQTFEKAYNNIETDPDLAIALAYSALESICKEILNDKRVTISYDNNLTLPKLISTLCKQFKFIDQNLPIEIKTIGSSLISIAKSIEDIRSNKTKAHGKTDNDYLIDDSIYTKFIINSVSSVGLFLLNFYEEKYPNLGQENDLNDIFLPF